ncbi:MAG: single-stranded-DNA-specific exonuclease RecJ [Legionellaceae bacterium]|nr:single-stranded-DNA-specific exonuclease RecJ [Legionellaceae bacterium]
MKKTIIQRPIPTNTQLTHLDPVLQRIYAARGVNDDTALQRDARVLLPYQSLKGINDAVDLLVNALQQQLSIMIIGDYDADGATSTSLAIRALRAMGAKHVSYLIPNRFEYGYGLSPELVKVAAKQQPDLLITVDNGISSLAGVCLAKEKGMQVLITDHHLPGEQLPEADVIVNPNQPDDAFPSKQLAGVGVMFYVLMALRARLREMDWFSQHNIIEPNLAQWLDIVALGTVADVVPLDQNNRVLVHQGLQRIRAGHCVPGIKALATVAGRELTKMTASDLGFVFGPRLNAAGRLDDMSIGIACLLADDETQAHQLAMQLQQLNHERRHIEKTMQKTAWEIVDQLKLSDNLPCGLCLFDEGWHQGVIGIVASRIKDKVHRPVIVFALENEGLMKGSARSISGLHVRDALAAIDAAHPNLIQKFGGHAMAAGLTIARDQFEQFQKLFADEVKRRVSEDDLQAKMLTDGELTERELTLGLAELLQQSGPWGQAFPEPLFEGEFELADQRIVGEKHLKMTLRKGDRLLDAIAFFVDTSAWPNQHCDALRIVYKLDVNEYMGNRRLQLIVEYMEPKGIQVNVF